MDSSSSSDCDPDGLIEYKPCTTDDEADESGVPRDVDRSETDELRCKICGDSVPTMARLIVHFLLQHEATGDASVQPVTRRQAKAMPDVRQKYLCGMCGVECFDTMRETRRHMFEEHGYQEPNARDSGADYSSDEWTDTDESASVSDNDSIDGVSSGMLSGMSSSTQYVSSPDSRRTRRRSYSYSSSEYEPERAGTLRKMLGSPPDPSPELGDSKKDAFEDYLRSATLKSLMEKFKSEMHHKCSRKGCQYKFTTGDVRERHLQCHADDNEPEASGGGKRKRFGFRCTQCDHRFDSWKPCMLHLWHQHQIDLGMLPCPLCEKRFVYVVHVFNHLQTHRPKSMREIECRICGQRFANTAQRSVHEALHRKKGHHAPLEVVREEEMPEYEPRAPVPTRKSDDFASKCQPKLAKKSPSHSGRRCKLCKRMFSNAKILSKHVKTVHFKIKPFICNVCGYKCARKVTLTIHMRQHSGVKPLACQSCSFRTADPSALYYHERRHREEKTYKCRMCGLTTVQPSALKRHIQSHHPQEYERIKCRLCSFASINAQNLRRHQADHEAGLIVSLETERRETDALATMGPGRTMSGARMEVKNLPDVSLDCFLPPESADSVVHDAGGITIPAMDGPVSVAHSEDTQFPL